MIHLIVGNTGAGKTTYANSLKEKIAGIVFSIDTWNRALFLADKKQNDGLEWMLERIDRAESVMMHLIEQLEASNTDAILDLGLSKFEHRKKFRNFATAHGYEVHVHFINVDTEIRLQRVLNRNKEKGETFEFEVTKENFDFMETWFEKPGQLEMKRGTIITE